jgi:peptide chain release factor 2
VNLFDLDAKKARVEEIDHLMADSSFWNDRKEAQKIINEQNNLKNIETQFNKLTTDVNNFLDELNLLKEEYNLEMHQLLETEFLGVSQNLKDFEMLVLLKEEYDNADAMIEIHPGAGGTESQDWAEMLYRMYVLYAEKNKYKIETLDYQIGDEAGIKSVAFVLKGPNAYGYLKGEKGVHRLVRISPFDASGRRHTSFASVDVIPVLNDDNNIVIDESELKIDTYRASGAGGQHINKTDSAVRITHIPTGIVVSCQSQRSQIQNKEQAMLALKSKLYQKKMEEQEKELDKIRGEQKSIEWGSQIRSYVFCPYCMVKDHRSEFQTSDVDGVMNGDLEQFIYSYLKMGI